MHLVAFGVGERALRVAPRRTRVPPAHQHVAEVAERARGVLALARGVGDLVRLEQRRRLAAVALHLRAGDVDERMRAGGVIPEPAGQLERALAPVDRLAGVVLEHGELGDAAVGTRELDRLAERLEDRDRLECLAPARARRRP